MVEKTGEILEENTENEGEELAEQPIQDIDSKYRMIILAAQRSKQLQRGAIPRIDVDMRKNKPTRVALREIKENKVPFDVLEN